MRYEYHPYFTERDGLQAIFDIAQQDRRAERIVEQGQSALAAELHPDRRSGTVGLRSDTLLTNDRNDFAPRIGLAYRPWETTPSSARLRYLLRSGATTVQSRDHQPHL